MVDQLENLVRVRKLHKETPDQNEFDGMLESATVSLSDAATPGLSTNSIFSLVYGAAHTGSLAALRWHGYRSTERYIVFQCLTHTIGLDTEKVRLLAECHRIRNLAEYEGHIEIGETIVQELKVVTGELLNLVKALGPVS